MNAPISDSDISADDARSRELNFAMCGSNHIRGRAIPAADDTEHASACSTTDAMAASAYTMTARVLHWLTAFWILAMMPLGVVIANEWGGPLQESFSHLHRSLGALLILI